MTPFLSILRSMRGVGAAFTAEAIGWSGCKALQTGKVQPRELCLKWGGKI